MQTQRRGDAEGNHCRLVQCLHVAAGHLDDAGSVAGGVGLSLGAQLLAFYGNPVAARFETSWSLCGFGIDWGLLVDPPSIEGGVVPQVARAGRRGCEIARCGTFSPGFRLLV